ncbi:hypothetical protein [Vibrio hippocampi]|uniref:Uncharacterized protein n=1 Tax=Vibrio hippocampi TaxID=654686 RepID=A0ABN8DFA3_9VIBR|nr:hypothetical protein [Vibrio hippocampi]CAH0524460.1 hypothetical protein VHP8226_00287 [Vibrio hippocampi]
MTQTKKMLSMIFCYLNPIAIYWYLSFYRDLEQAVCVLLFCLIFSLIYFRMVRFDKLELNLIVKTMIFSSILSVVCSMLYQYVFDGMIFGDGFHHNPIIFDVLLFYVATVFITPCFWVNLACCLVVFLKRKHLSYLYGNKLFHAMFLSYFNPVFVFWLYLSYKEIFELVFVYILSFFTSCIFIVCRKYKIKHIDVFFFPLVQFLFVQYLFVYIYIHLFGYYYSVTIWSIIKGAFISIFSTPLVWMYITCYYLIFRTYNCNLLDKIRLNIIIGKETTIAVVVSVFVFGIVYLSTISMISFPLLSISYPVKASYCHGMSNNNGYKLHIEGDGDYISSGFYIESISKEQCEIITDSISKAKYLTVSYFYNAKRSEAVMVYKLVSGGDVIYNHNISAYLSGG